jgi:hypothetical protein
MCHPHALWIFYKVIEGDLAGAQYTRTEIREYISAVQSHNEPSSLGTSIKSLPTPGESYLAPKGHFFKESSYRIALTLRREALCIYDTSERKSLLIQAHGNYQRRRHSTTHSR